MAARATKKKTTTRKKAATKAPTKRRAPKPVSTAAVATDLASAIATSQAAAGSSGMSFAKFEEGENTYQFVLDPNGMINLKGVYHNGTSTEGKFSQVADLTFVCNSPQLTEAAVKAGKLTDEDLNLMAKYGDPAERGGSGPGPRGHPQAQGQPLRRRAGELELHQGW
jgi:hypothetical protein